MKDENAARNSGSDGAGAARSEMKRLKQAKETLIRERQEIYSARDSAKANLDAKVRWWWRRRWWCWWCVYSGA